MHCNKNSNGARRRWGQVTSTLLREKTIASVTPTEPSRRGTALSYAVEHAARRFTDVVVIMVRRVRKIDRAHVASRYAQKAKPGFPRRHVVLT